MSEVAGDLGCHGTRYVRYARGGYAYPVRTVRGALAASRPAPPVRTQRVRVAYTYATEAPGSTRQLSAATARKTTSQARADSSVNSSIFLSPAQRGVAGTPWAKSPTHAHPNPNPNV